MPDPEINNPIMRNLSERREGEARTRAFYENQVEYKARRIKEIRNQYAKDLAKATEELRAMEKALQDAITSVNAWEAAIRALKMMSIAGEPSALQAIGEEIYAKQKEETTDGNDGQPKV